MSPSDAPSRPSEQRRWPRTVVSMLVQYRFDTLEDFVAEYSVNLSPGGIFIATDKPKGVGAIVYLQFALKDGSRLIEGLGQVARVVRPGGAEPAGMGVQFLNFDEESLALVRKICEQP